MRFRIEPQLQEIISMELRIQKLGNAAKLGTEISAITMEVLNEMSSDKRNAFYQVINGKTIRGIAARIARATLFRMTNENALSIERNKERSDFEFIDEIQGHVRDEFCEWWNGHQEYVSSRELSQEKAYLETKGEPAEDSDVALVLESIERMNFSIDPELRKIYDQVRCATYGTITAENIGEILPKIARAYKTSWLDSDTLMRLLRNNPEEQDKFDERTQRGVFLYGFSERVNGKPSVEEQMYTELLRDPKEGPVFKGKYLMDDDGQLLAWLTYWQPEMGLNNGHEQMVTDYLENGVTGKPMTYTRTPKKEEHLSFAKQTLMFDTIWAGKRFAARRLLPKALMEMWNENRSIRRFVGYRLNGIETMPSYTNLSDHPRIAENWYSSRFFLERKCSTFAHDFNEDGPKSTRQLMNGLEMKINPEWAAFYGDFSKVLRASWKLWKDTQQEFGDVSADGYDHMAANYRPPVIPTT